MKTSKVLLNLSSFICFVYGALYIFSLVFIPIGIYCMIAGKRFSYKADNIENIFALDKNVFKNYVIIASIACFPFGMISIIPYIMITGNNVKVSTSESSSNNIKEDENKVNVNAQDDDINVTSKSTQSVETEAEKKEKFEKLKNFKEKGLITEDELEMAREQLFGKDKTEE